jgi:hypothetical protein
MSSFSTMTTPAGSQMVSEMVLTLSFSASGPGIYEVGPLTFTATGTGRLELPELTIVAAGSGRGRRSRTLPGLLGPASGEPQGRDTAWVDASVDTLGTVYPGCTFEVSYYLCSRNSNIWSVNYRVLGSDYASSRTLEAPEELLWRRGPDGERRSLLARLEITPAFPCSLSLPVIRGVATVRSGLTDVEIDLPSDTAWVPVMPFPTDGQPANFHGASACLSIALSRAPGGYSLAAERCLNLEISGPGSAFIQDPPPLTVSGPASIRYGPREESVPGDRAGWLVLVQPSDSGTVILGPDSLAWFDPACGEYRQSVLPACTLTVRAPERSMALPVIDTGSNDGTAVLPWVLGILSLSVLILAVFRSVRNRGACSSITEVGDAEELLTALEGELCLMLTGTRASMGFEELGEALDDSGVDNILSRRLLRYWKDLEMCLSRPLSADQLGTLQRNASELLEDLAAEIKSLRG